METTTKQWGAIGLLALIVAALGGTMYLTPDQLDHAYICTANQNVVIADHLSTTLKTAYWNDESGVSKSKTCTGGVWTVLKQYAKDNKLDINVLLKNINVETVIPENNNTIISNPINSEMGISYRCDQEKCVRI